MSFKKSHHGSSSSSLSKPSKLNPYAPEWRPTTTTHHQNTTTPLSTNHHLPHVLHDEYKGQSVIKEPTKSPKCPPHTDRKHGGRRAVRSFHMEEKPVVNKVWRPKQTSFDSADVSTNTTVMIKNVPNKLRSDFMLKFLDKICKAHTLAYDFLYLPMDFKSKDNLGYAFVNFTTVAAAVKFKNILQDFKWETICSTKKICDITWARIQGKRSLVERFKNSIFPCDRLDFLPLILDPPRNGLDPNPSPPFTVGTLGRKRRG